MDSGMKVHDLYPSVLVREVIEAHGGMALWNNLEALEADISARGLLFTMKRQPVMNHVQVRASATKPYFIFLDFPGPGQIGEFIGDETVHVLDSSGEVVAMRIHPRSAFRGLRRQLYWDSLDFIYFAGYATWNYLLTPFLFLRDGFTFETLAPLPGMPLSWTGLRVTFPDDVPTHSRKQEFYFDEKRYLRRLDYTAEVVGRWAHAAHLCENYKDFNGLKIATRRRVRPLFFGSNPLPIPTLVALEIHDIQLIQG
jgi:hypothetical protein